MANELHLAIPDLDADLNAVLQVADPNDLNLKHFLLTLQQFRNLTTLEQKMSAQIDALTAEVASDVTLMQAAAKTISAADDALALLKTQLANATNPADQAAIQTATSNLAAARAELQTAVDAGNAANPPAATGTATGTASSTPTPSPTPSPAPTGTAAASATPSN